MLFSQILTAQTIRNYSNEFLNIGVDAAAFGMGKAVTSLSKDVNSIYWNPAGLVNVEDQQASLMHAEYFQGIAKYDFGAYAKQINNSTAFALSLTRFSVDDILNTTQLIDSQGNIDFNRVSLFNASDMALQFGFAKRLLHKDINIGISGKIIHRRIGDFANSWGFGLDAGMQFSSKKYHYGIMIRDITTTFNAWSIDSAAFDAISSAIPGQNQEKPETLELTKPKLQVGMARDFQFGHDYKLTTAVDLQMRFLETNDIISSSFASINPAIGFEFSYDNMIYLRTGVTNFQETTNFDESTSVSVEPNFGVGFEYNGIHIDYALSNIGGASGTLYSNVFSVKVELGKFIR